MPGELGRPTGGAADDGGGRSQRWVNPFVLPGGMTFRFVLLVGAVFATSVYCLWLFAPPGPAALSSTLSRCEAVTGISGSIHLFSAGVAEGPYIEAVSARYARCLAPIEHAHDWWMLGLLLVLAVATGLGYWLIPWWKIRRRRLVPLAGGTTPEAAALMAELDALVAETGLARAPTFLLDPVSPAISGLAFGRFGRYYIRLDAGLIVLRGRDPAGFRSVVRHELAHLLNRDVDQTYLTVALWRAFVLIVLVPLAAVFLTPALVRNPLHLQGLPVAPGTLPLLGDLWLPVLLLTASVYLLRNAVLRSRELYADLRAAEPGAGRDLIRILQPSAPRRRSRVSSIPRGLLGTHPATEVRRAAVADPGPLFQLGFWETAAAGVVIALSYGLSTLILDLSAVPLGDALGAPALILAVITGGLLTLALWRGTTYALVTGQAPRSVIRPAAGLAVGLTAGAALVKPSVGWGGPPVLVAAMTGVVLTVVAGWIAGLAATWLPAARGHSLRWAWLLAAAAASVIVAAVFELWLAPDGLRGYYHAVYNLEAGAYTRAGLIGWTGPRWLWSAAFLPSGLGTAAIRLGFIALLLLWAVPLAVWTRAAPATGPAWLRRALPRENDPAPLARELPRTGPAAVAGAVAGGAAFAGQFALRALLHTGLPLEVRRTGELAVLLTYWQLGIAVLAQAIVAAVVAATARRCGVLLGLLAASITAGLATLGDVAAARVGSCVSVFTVRPQACQLRPTGAFVALVLQLNALDGGAAALLAVLVAAGTRAALRRHRPPGPAAGPALARPGRPPGRSPRAGVPGPGRPGQWRRPV